MLPADGGDCEAVLAQFASGRHRPRCPGRPAPGGRRKVVRQVLARAHGGDRLEERAWRRQLDLNAGRVRSKYAIRFTTYIAMRDCMNVLVVDVGGTHVKILATGKANRGSSPPGRPDRRADGRRRQGARRGWKYDVVSIGYPGPGAEWPPGRGAAQPRSGLGRVRLRGGFGCPVKVINDAAMQALGGYKGGKCCSWAGHRAGLHHGRRGIVEPMELGHLPYRKGTYEDYVGLRGLERLRQEEMAAACRGRRRRLIAALEPDDVVIGGGNVKKLRELPPGCRLGDNTNAFVGGFRLWEERRTATAKRRRTTDDGHARTPSPHARPGRRSQAHYEKIRKLHLRQLFADDPSAASA